MSSCDEARVWLDRDTGGRSAPPGVDDHLRTCPDCRRLASVRARAVEDFRRAAEREPPPLPSLDRMAARARALRVRRNVRRAGLVILPAAAAAMIAALLWPGSAPEPLPVPPGVATEVAPPAPAPAPSPAPASPPERPRAGQVVETTASEVVLSEPGVGSIVVASRTRTRIAAWAGGSTRLELDAGRMDAAVDPQPADGSFEVRTDYVTVRVVGTRFSVEHRPGVRTVVSGLEGVVAVLTPDGRELARVRAGDVALAGPGVPGGFLLRRPGDGAAIDRHPTRPVEVPGPVATEPPPPEPVAQVLSRARQELLERDEDAAIDLLAGALERAGPERPRLLALLGDALRLAGRSEEARGVYERAIAEGGRALPEGVYADLAAVNASLGRAPDAAETWRRYLEARPEGRYKGMALARLAEAADAAGRTDESVALLRRLVAEAPSSPEAPAAFSRVGKVLLDRGDFRGAETWFAARRNDAHPGMAEAALVGLMRLAAHQGRDADLAALKAEYVRRFPEGTRRAEVDRL